MWNWKCNHKLWYGPRPQLFNIMLKWYWEYNSIWNNCRNLISVWATNSDQQTWERRIKLNILGCIVAVAITPQYMQITSCSFVIPIWRVFIIIFIVWMHHLLKMVRHSGRQPSSLPFFEQQVLYRFQRNNADTFTFGIWHNWRKTIGLKWTEKSV